MKKYCLVIIVGLIVGACLSTMTRNIATVFGQVSPENNGMSNSDEPSDASPNPAIAQTTPAQTTTNTATAAAPAETAKVETSVTPAAPVGVSETPQNTPAAPTILPAQATTDVFAPADNEKIYTDMDNINLQMAKTEMEIKLAKLELEKMDLLQKEEEMKKKLGETGYSNLARQGISQPTEAVADDTPEVISIMALGKEKIAYININGHHQELHEGDVVASAKGDIKVNEINSQTNSVTLEQNGKETRYVMTGVK